MRLPISPHSNLGPILHRFGDIAGFCAPEWPHPYSTLILGVFPLDLIAHVGVSPRISLTLFGREIIFEDYSNLCDHDTYTSRTDGRTIQTVRFSVCPSVTDRQTIYCGIISLCVASRGNKIRKIIRVRKSRRMSRQCVLLMVLSGSKTCGRNLTMQWWYNSITIKWQRKMMVRFTHETYVKIRNVHVRQNNVR